MSDSFKTFFVCVWIEEEIMRDLKTGQEDYV